MRACGFASAGERILVPSCCSITSACACTRTRAHTLTAERLPPAPFAQCLRQRGGALPLHPRLRVPARERLQRCALQAPSTARLVCCAVRVRSSACASGCPSCMLCSPACVRAGPRAALRVSCSMRARLAAAKRKSCTAAPRGAQHKNTCWSGGCCIVVACCTEAGSERPHMSNVLVPGAPALLVCASPVTTRHSTPPHTPSHAHAAAWAAAWRRTSMPSCSIRVCASRPPLCALPRALQPHEQPPPCNHNGAGAVRAPRRACSKQFCASPCLHTCMCLVCLTQQRRRCATRAPRGSSFARAPHSCAHCLIMGWVLQCSKQCSTRVFSVCFVDMLATST